MREVASSLVNTDRPFLCVVHSPEVRKLPAGYAMLTAGTAAVWWCRDARSWRCWRTTCLCRSSRLSSALLLGAIITATSFRAFVQALAAMDAGVILTMPFLKVR
jgi:hypothetical protein